MTSSAIVQRYASALADVVTAPASTVKPQDALSQLREFTALIAESDTLRNALESPAVSLSRKRAVIDRFVGMLGTARTIRNFLLVLSDHRRMGALHEIVEAFDIQLDERLGFIRADISSAQVMDSSEQNALAGRLSGLTGKQVRMRFTVAPDLIGGVVARVGSKVYDGSVRGRLSTLARRLSA